MVFLIIEYDWKAYETERRERDYDEKKKTFSQYFLIVIAANLENVVSFKTPRNMLYNCKRLMV